MEGAKQVIDKKASVPEWSIAVGEWRKDLGSDCAEPCGPS